MELPTDKHAVLRIMARPSDVNISGDIFGGWLMSQCDIAAGIVARKIAGGRVVTVSVKEFQFLAPVLIADIVSIYATESRVGTTSVTVDIDVLVERLAENETQTLNVAQAQIVFVHIDENRQPKNINQQ